MFFPLFPTFRHRRKKKTINALAEVDFSPQNERKCHKNIPQELLPAQFHTPDCHIWIFHAQTAGAASLPSFLLIFFPQDFEEKKGEKSPVQAVPQQNPQHGASRKSIPNTKTSGRSFFLGKPACLGSHLCS